MIQKNAIKELAGVLNWVLKPRRTLRRLRYEAGTDKRPKINDADAVARYIQRNIGDVESHHPGKLPLFYIVPQFHPGGHLLGNWEELDWVVKAFKLRIVGNEGFVGPIDQAMLEEKLNNHKPTLKKYLEAKPPLVYALDENPGICIGLEDEVISDDAHNLREADKNIGDLWEAHFLNRESLRDKVSKRAVYRSYIADLKRDILPLITKFLPILSDPLKQDPEVWFSPFSPFKKDLHNLARRYTMDKRSEAAVAVAFEACKEYKEPQAAIVYGYGHKEQIQDEIKKQGRSYITLL